MTMHVPYRNNRIVQTSVPGGHDVYFLHSGKTIHDALRIPIFLNRFFPIS